jgi:hypothetical protein
VVGALDNVSDLVNRGISTVSLAQIGCYVLWPVRRVKNINFLVSKYK